MRGCRLYKAVSVDGSCRQQVRSDHEKETSIDLDSIGLGDEVRRAYYQQQAEQMQEKARERKEQAAAEWQEWQVSTYDLGLLPDSVRVVLMAMVFSVSLMRGLSDLHKLVRPDGFCTRKCETLVECLAQSTTRGRI